MFATLKKIALQFWYKIKLPDRMFTENFDLSDDDKTNIVTLRADDRFRAIDKYLVWKQNAKARQLHALVKAGKFNEASYVSGQIDFAGEVTQDFAVFWEEIKNKDTEAYHLPEVKRSIWGKDRIIL